MKIDDILVYSIHDQFAIETSMLYKIMASKIIGKFNNWYKNKTILNTVRSRFTTNLRVFLRPNEVNDRISKKEILITSIIKENIKL
jgi:hypothetical protein